MKPQPIGRYTLTPSYEDLQAEIARLRDALDEQTGRAVWNYDCLTQCEERVIQRDAEIERLRLTHAEREAIDDAIYLCEAEAGLFGERAAATKWATCAAALRGLLERLGGER